ncbi:UBA/TS-N domain-containing protein [Besnoitia besnoiti]|uniref:UBA/TS-N domain-containing protein n=1 Tax=Besnoitia besnoiti TaxID=94643 RepID=A0A2A9MQY7_BESBE|nr:UBA/TS-N domain-containing protein [Besnoitia besnoiti]PFH38592.1 UBA/TS-N domain-containing protein [Besnoitia besnoiti]
MEDSLAMLKADILFFLSRLQHGSVEMSLKAQDPVFEGMVRDFYRFDESLEALQAGVSRFLEGIESLCGGLSGLSEAAVLHLTKKSDACIARDACLYREAVHRITRADAPHAAYAKLKRDLQFNVTEPLRKHREHNAKLKQDIQTRNRRLAEWLLAKRKVELLRDKHAAATAGGRGAAETPEDAARDRAEAGSGAEEEDAEGSPRSAAGSFASSSSRLLSSGAVGGKRAGARKWTATIEKDLLFAEAAVETARLRFKEVDDVLFEWLQMLEAYKCDIFDSALQTLKYLQYEFCASSAHAVARVLPSRMEFRPMVEMTPQLLLPQVELELAERTAAEAEAEAQRRREGAEDSRSSPVHGGVTGSGLSATERLVEKWEREATSCTWVADASAAGAPPVLMLASQLDGADAPEGGGAEAAGSEVTVDILSLAVLTAQGFEEVFAKKALQRHENDTQAAMDWLLSGGVEELQRERGEEKRRAAEEEERRRNAAQPASATAAGAGAGAAAAGLEEVRLPTTLKWVQKLKAAKKKERQTWQQKRRAQREVAALAAEKAEGERKETDAAEAAQAVDSIDARGGDERTRRRRRPAGGRDRAESSASEKTSRSSSSSSRSRSDDDDAVRKPRRGAARREGEEGDEAQRGPERGEAAEAPSPRSRASHRRDEPSADALLLEGLSEGAEARLLAAEGRVASSASAEASQSAARAASPDREESSGRGGRAEETRAERAASRHRGSRHRHRRGGEHKGRWQGHSASSLSSRSSSLSSCSEVESPERRHRRSKRAERARNGGRARRAREDGERGGSDDWDSRRRRDNARSLSRSSRSVSSGSAEDDWDLSRSRRARGERRRRRAEGDDRRNGGVACDRQRLDCDARLTSTASCPLDDLEEAFSGSRGVSSPQVERRRHSRDASGSTPPLPDLLGGFDTETPGCDWGLRKPSFAMPAEDFRAQRDASEAEEREEEKEDAAARSRRARRRWKATRRWEDEGRERERGKTRERAGGAERAEARRARRDASSSSPSSSASESRGRDAECEETRRPRTHKRREDPRESASDSGNEADARPAQQNGSAGWTAATSSVADRMSAFNDLL